MQISAINPSFSGKRDRIDEVIALDDSSVRRLAYLKTLSKSDEQKHRRITNGLIVSSPIAMGIAAAALTSGKTKIFSKEVSGVTAKLANGLKYSSSWGAALGAVGLVGVVKSILSKKSEKVRNFEDKNPLLSFAMLIGAGFGAIALVNKGIAKLATKKAPKVLQNLTGRFNYRMNTSKYVNKLSESLVNVGKKIPSPLKLVGLKSLVYLPSLLLLGGVVHSISHNFAVRKDFAKNYSDIKEKQLNLAKARQRELAMENDFLKTDAKNREDLALVKDPLKDLNDEASEYFSTSYDSVDGE